MSAAHHWGVDPVSGRVAHLDVLPALLLLPADGSVNSHQDSRAAQGLRVDLALRLINDRADDSHRADDGREDRGDDPRALVADKHVLRHAGLRRAIEHADDEHENDADDDTDEEGERDFLIHYLVLLDFHSISIHPAG